MGWSRFDITVGRLAHRTRCVVGDDWSSRHRRELVDVKARMCRRYQAGGKEEGFRAGGDVRLRTTEIP